MRWLRLLAASLVLALGFVVVAAQPAQAACEGDPPVPARPGPYEGAVIHEDVRAPFVDDTSIQSVFGTTPQVWNYDNGCTPGSGIMPSVGAALANLAFKISGAEAGWTQALLEAVISPEWAAPLDRPVASATTDVAQGTWTPWLVVALTIVAVIVLLRSREGHFSGAITATVWALLVLVGVSWVVSYPTESVEAVDGTVRTAVVEVGGGFSGGPATGETDEERALNTVDQQIGSVVYTVQYRTWLAAVFGDADSETAREFGPAIFYATHFTWSEWTKYRSDPDGAGAEILEDKQNTFRATAEAIKEKDPEAYRYFTGDQWGSRLASGIVSVLVMTSICAFLLISGVMVLASFAIVRLLVPFTPALGVLFILDVARERAVDVFRRVGGVLVMGPVYFVASLVLLRFYGELMAADMPFLLRLTFVIALSIMAWRVLRPAAQFGRVRVPGRRALRRHMHLRRSGGSSSGATTAGTESQPVETISNPRRGPVFNGNGTVQSTPPPSAGTPGTFVTRETAVEPPDDGAAEHTIKRPLPLGSRQAPPSGDARAVARTTRGPSSTVVASGARADHSDADVGAGRPNDPGRAMAGSDDRRATSVPAPTPSQGSMRVNEANLTYDENGQRVFVVYTPGQVAS